MFSHLNYKGYESIRLTLRYADELRSGGTDPGRHKHEIRKKLHDQLATHWQSDLRLAPLLPKLMELQIAALGAHQQFDVERPVADRGLMWRYPLGGYNFVPLANHVHEIHCELDIRIYRKRGYNRLIYEGGDLDNRISTFLDALTVPKELNRFPAQEVEGGPGKWPIMFCLVDDDKAITKLSIESIRLLTPIPNHIVHQENYAELDVDVKLKPGKPIVGNYPMLFD